MAILKPPNFDQEMFLAGLSVIALLIPSCMQAAIALI